MNFITHAQDIHGTQNPYLTDETMEQMAAEFEHAHHQALLDDLLEANQHHTETKRAVFQARHALYLAMQTEAKAERTWLEALGKAADHGHPYSDICRYGRLSARRLESTLANR